MERATLPSRRASRGDVGFGWAPTFDGEETLPGFTRSDRITGEEPPLHSGTVAPVRRPNWKGAYLRRVAVTDLVMVTATTIGSVLLYFGNLSAEGAPALGGISYLAIAGILTAGWFLCLALAGVWAAGAQGPGTGEYRKLLNATVVMVGVIVLGSYLFKAELSRGYLAVMLPLSLAGLLLGRSSWRIWLSHQRRSGRAMASVLVVGGPEEAEELASYLERAPGAGYRIAGLCLPLESALTAATAAGDRPVLGDFDQIIETVESSGAHVVAIAGDGEFGSVSTRELARHLEDTGIELILAPALTEVADVRIRVKTLSGLPLMHVEEPQFQRVKIIGKRAIDYVGAAVGLLLLSPFFLVAAVAIKVSDPGPVFFRQDRVGLHGKIFRIWKFRTMAVGTHDRHSRVRAKGKHPKTVFYKSADPSQITKVGGFLRRTSIDELPQLINILAGHMSIVGPRPLVPGEAAGIPGYLERRARVHPGLTGLWQVSGRSDVSAHVRVQLDLYYVSNWSIQGDLAIIAKTAASVLSRKGAY
ncbi:sugar transferase [Nakamurella silvestris]|nr:sugar transferase [Nakamurella silvestris]